MTFLYVLFAILIFGVLIAVHEFGHFATAKACGVQVDEFAVGMGPALWKKRKGETLYALRAVPFGVPPTAREMKVSAWARVSVSFGWNCASFAVDTRPFSKPQSTGWKK